MTRPLTLSEIRSTLDALDSAYDALAAAPYSEHIGDLQTVLEAAESRMIALLRIAELATHGKLTNADAPERP